MTEMVKQKKNSKAVGRKVFAGDRRHVVGKRKKKKD